MEIKSELDELTLIELNVLLEHIRLGQPHLKQYLNLNQFNALLKLGNLNNNQKKNVTYDKKESTGNAALAVNTVITSMFGAWMGFASFMEMKLGRFTHLFVICIVTAIISGILGYYSFKLTKSQVQSAVTTQKLHNLELYLIKLIEQKRQVEINKIIIYLNKSLINLSLEEQHKNNQFDSKEAISNWLTQLNQALQQKVASLPQEEIYQIYKNELDKIKTRLKKILSHNDSLIEKDNLEATLDPQLNKEANKKSDFVKTLTNPNLATSKQNIRVKALTPKNLLIILIQLVPTLLGCFASMFVFLTGGPDLAKEFGANTLLAILTDPQVRILEFAVAIGLTIYYCILNIYNNYRNFKREAELEKAEKLIVNEEIKMIEANNKLNMLKKVKEQIRKTNYVYKVLKQVTKYLSEKYGNDIVASDKNKMIKHKALEY